MGIKDQFKDKAQELADQAKQAKQAKQGRDGREGREGREGVQGTQPSRGGGLQDEASERMRRAREDDRLDDELGEGPERYRG
ncbi:hypothetical protein J7E96_25075 [Streptomyces sp. ISL-96]|uniref:hypothetical protein n=1 Tax=Streptomyces sp. ISL-96 TaxID=2819191 RepID=UPI001BEA30BB|nr:hypothetical protein [Streptomyces sp. ISL-96]MBT2491740.1 hypothetical protein [Streptomyces sp. ISL-96]